MAFQVAVPLSCCNVKSLSAPISAVKHQAYRPRFRVHVPRAAAQDASSSPEQSLTPLSSDSSAPRRRNIDVVKKFAISLCIGTAGSTVGSLIGAGGGVVVTPLLTSFGLSQHVAHGTSLCVITVTAAMSAFRYASASKLRIYGALMLASGAIFTAPLGARRSARVNAKALKGYFGIFLLVVSVLIPVLPYVTASGQQVALPLIARNILLAIIGLASGFLSGLLGIGGGTINVPALVILAGFSQKVAQGTALLAMLIPSVIASISHSKLNHVSFDLLPGLVLGAMVGASYGSKLALFLPEQSLRVLCAFIFFSIGVRYLLPKKAEKRSQ